MSKLLTYSREVKWTDLETNLFLKGIAEAHFFLHEGYPQHLEYHFAGFFLLL